MNAAERRKVRRSGVVRRQPTERHLRQMETARRRHLEAAGEVAVEVLKAYRAGRTTQVPREGRKEEKMNGLIRGVKTSEFWLALAAALTSATAGFVEGRPELGLLGAVIATGLYAVSRGLAKIGGDS